MAVVNMYLKKRVENGVMYKNRGKVHTARLHLMQRVQSEIDRRLKSGVRGESS